MLRRAIQLLLGPENDAIEVGGSSRETGSPSLRAAGTVYSFRRVGAKYHQNWTFQQENVCFLKFSKVDISATISN